VSTNIDNLVVKVAERCNLNCTYCFMYQHEDQGYRSRPKFLEPPVYEQLFVRMREYCERRPDHKMSLTLHGGEPTLFGIERTRRMVMRAREVVGDRLGSVNLQSNGTLLDASWARLAAECGVSIGVSLDGPPEIHDAARVDHGGRGSHRAAVRGLRALQEVGFHPGVLCVINPGASGLDAYRHFRSLGVTSMDFLFPDVSWDSKEAWYGEFGPTPVSDYLIPIFDDWFAADDPDVKVRVLWGLLSALLGGGHPTDAFGNPMMSYLIIETDGSIRGLDALRVCEDGIDDSGLTVFDHGFDDLAEGLPLVHAVVNEGIALSSICRSCSDLDICGGGYLPHRFSKAKRFDNPSVWCEDIRVLIAHLRSAITVPVDDESSIPAVV
jgi:uncharacterized protein